MAYMRRGRTAPQLTSIGLFALQHRGQESAGVAAVDQGRIKLHTGMGLVSEAFRDGDIEGISGEMAIGHTRYSTTGASRSANAQPLLVEGLNGPLAVAHNGNIINSRQLREQVQSQWNCVLRDQHRQRGYRSPAGQRSGQNLARAGLLRHGPDARGILADAVDSGCGHSGTRSPWVSGPCAWAAWKTAGPIASETCALDHMQAEFTRELEPGEVVVISGDGLESAIYGEAARRSRALCVFEWIYFARPDSVMDNRLMHTVREDMGARLAREHPVDADLVIGIPDSSTSAAVGFSRESGIPFANGLVRNRYVGRTFIEPEQQRRDRGVRQKFNPMPAVLAGKRLVVVDDSIVRGTTTPHVVDLLRRAGATEIHLRVCAPPIKHPCYLGVDMATRQELIAANKSIPEIRELTGADSLGYLSVRGLMDLVHGQQGGFCDACFTGNYPVPVQLELTKQSLERATA